MKTGKYMVFNQFESFFAERTSWESTYTDIGIFIADVVSTKPDEDELVNNLKKISSGS